MRRSTRWLVSVLLPIALAMGVSGPLGGCGLIPQTVQNVPGDVEKTFNNALADLNAGSVQWQTTLSNLSNNLIAQGQQTLANQVQSLLARGIAAAAVEAKCTVDFLRARLSELVQGILDGFLGRAVQPPMPHFCSADPIAIDLRLTPSQRAATLNVYGFNLSPQNVSVTVRGDDNTSRGAQQFFNVPNEYTATFDLVGYPFSVHNQSVVFRLSNGEVWTVGIVQAASCGGVGQPCCTSGTRCNPGSGCQAGTCVTCPPPFVPVLDTLVNQVNETAGPNCFGVNDTRTYGGSCKTGKHRVQCQVTAKNPAQDAFCQEMVQGHLPTDCTCTVMFHTPADCTKQIACSVVVTEVDDAPPPPPAGCP